MYSLSQKNKIFNKFDEKIEFYSLKGNSKNSDNLYRNKSFFGGIDGFKQFAASSSFSNCNA